MDPAKKVEGVWVDFGGEASFKIASLSNPDFQKAFSAKRSPYDKMRKELSDEEMLDIMTFCLARYVVLDWKNVFENNTEVPYSIEKAEDVLSRVEWVRERVIEEARKISNFSQDTSEEIEKN
jgi:hypothetical protein